MNKTIVTKNGEVHAEDDGNTKIVNKTNITKEHDETVKAVVEKMCQFFLLSHCRHGYSGRKPFEGKKICRFFHPVLCKKYLKNGLESGGCDGSDYEKTHPTICKSSLKKWKCFTKGKCRAGWHLKKTKFLNTDKEIETTISKSSTSGSKTKKKTEKKALVNNEPEKKKT